MKSHFFTILPSTGTVTHIQTDIQTHRRRTLLSHETLNAQGPWSNYKWSLGNRPNLAFKLTKRNSKTLLLVSWALLGHFSDLPDFPVVWKIGWSIPSLANWMRDHSTNAVSFFFPSFSHGQDHSWLSKSNGDRPGTAKEICFKLARECRRQGCRRRGGINPSPHVPLESAGVLGETMQPGGGRNSLFRILNLLSEFECALVWEN